ncbi:MAG: antitoxin VbhA family protein [Raoultibacter sp.]
MIDIEEIIANTKASMAMENMPLSKSDEEMIRECLTGKKTFKEAEAELLAKYKIA